MSTRYLCKNERRRARLRDSDLNGIDYLEVLDKDAPGDTPRQRTLLVYMLKNEPWGLSTNNVRIDGGVQVTGIKVAWALRASENLDRLNNEEPLKSIPKDLPEKDRVLVVRTNSSGDYSAYTLRLVDASNENKPPANFDPILSHVTFSFKVECPNPFDCRAETMPTHEIDDAPPIDYMAKDYASFRKLMLDRLSVILPDWQDRSPADVGMALVEVLAYTADYLSYYQDAVATEAYLGTARLRTSVRRHTRLLDYTLHDGCNARTWVQFQVGAQVTLEKGTQVLTRLGGQSPRISPDSAAYDKALDQKPAVFETMYRATLFPEHNRIDFYTWGDDECCLPAGATRATLKGSLPNLKRGDVLVFIEERSAETGKAVDADPTHRHAVRLLHVNPEEEDPLFKDDDGKPLQVTEITWMDEDALPFPICLTMVEIPAEERKPGTSEKPLASVALGNVILADHGRTITGEELPAPNGHRRYRPRLQETDITYHVPYARDDAEDEKKAATVSLQQDPRQALPAVTLHGNGVTWLPQRDLLGSGRFARDFVVEPENDGRARLRFGNDRYGREPLPTETLTAHYRIGNGPTGNVSAEALSHVVTQHGVTSVRNPLPAQSGAAPESLEEARLYAPQAFRIKERAVIEDDYADMAQRHPEVQRAVATRRWTGSWHTMFLTVDRKGGLAVDDDFEKALRHFLERFRLAGHDLEIDGPRFVALDIALGVCVKPGYYPSKIKAALFEVFSNGILADGQRGFFHPDNFTFKQTVYLSQIIATAMTIPGVRWIDTSHSKAKFQRWGKGSQGKIKDSKIVLERLEIARLDNDPSQPHNGHLEFMMDGGI